MANLLKTNGATVVVEPDGNGPLFGFTEDEICDLVDSEIVELFAFEDGGVLFFSNMQEIPEQGLERVLNKWAMTIIKHNTDPEDDTVAVFPVIGDAVYLPPDET
jgi:hypothetical protein